MNASSSVVSTRIIEISRGRNGYGFTLSGQDPCFVSWVVKLSPADKIGLTVGDYVISVNGQDVSRSTHEAVVKLIGVSSGTLFLGVSKTINEIESNYRREMQPSGYYSDQSMMEQTPPKSSFSRTEKVLDDLRSGVIFKSMSSPSSGSSKLDGFMRSGEDVMSSQKNEAPRMVMMKAIVAYLGTVEMPVSSDEVLEHSSVDAVRRCVRQLRIEQHIHQRVLMKVTQSSVELHNADGDTIGLYDSNKLRFSAACPEDGRFFCIVTAQNDDFMNEMTQKFFCHIFMVDPDVAHHSSHSDKARRFGIECSTNKETGNCVEFPKSPRNLLAVIQLLYTATDSPTIDYSTNVPPPGDQSTTNLRVHLVAPQDPPHAGLTRGESSLPPASRIAWLSTLEKRSNPERRTSSGNEDSSRLSPRALFASELQDGTSDESSQEAFTNQSKPRHLDAAAEKVSSKPRVTFRHNIATLNQENLLNHDKQMSKSVMRNMIPPPMHKMSMGKYRKQESRFVASSGDRRIPVSTKEVFTWYRLTKVAVKGIVRHRIT